MIDTLHINKNESSIEDQVTRSRRICNKASRSFSS